MRPEELRIGNLVEFKAQVVPILKIDSMNELIEAGALIYKGSVTVPEYSNCRDRRIWNYNSPWIQQINPVPITEEWLNRFKLKHSKHVSDLDDSVINEFNFGRLCIVSWDENKTFTLSNAFSFDLRPKISWVHQLQNLIYAITGEEITTNTPKG